MTVVYIDLLFLLNLIANYLLLLGAGRMAGAVLRRWKIGLAGALGALYAAAVFLPGMGWLSAWPCKLLSGVLMVLVAYGSEGRLFRVSALFFGASMGLAGLIMALELLGGAALTLENGVLYSRFDLRLLLLTFIIFYCTMSVFFARLGRHGSREIIPLEIKIGEEAVKVNALLDSGNTLTDPVNNLPVVVVEGQRFSHMLPDGLNLAQPVECIKRCREAGMEGTRLIPYRAVGVECGMLLALRAKSVTAGGKSLGGLLVALSPTSVSDGGNYQALIGGMGL